MKKQTMLKLILCFLIIFVGINVQKVSAAEILCTSCTYGKIDTQNETCTVTVVNGSNAGEVIKHNVVKVGDKYYHNLGKCKTCPDNIIYDRLNTYICLSTGNEVVKDGAYQYWHKTDGYCKTCKKTSLVKRDDEAILCSNYSGALSYARGYSDDIDGYYHEDDYINRIKANNARGNDGPTGDKCQSCLNNIYIKNGNYYCDFEDDEAIEINNLYYHLKKGYQYCKNCKKIVNIGDCSSHTKINVGEYDWDKTCNKCGKTFLVICNDGKFCTECDFGASVLGQCKSCGGGDVISKNNKLLCAKSYEVKNINCSNRDFAGFYHVSSLSADGIYYCKDCGNGGRLRDGSCTKSGHTSLKTIKMNFTCECSKSMKNKYPVYLVENGSLYCMQEYNNLGKVYNTGIGQVPDNAIGGVKEENDNQHGGGGGNFGAVTGGPSASAFFNAGNSNLSTAKQKINENLDPILHIQSLIMMIGALISVIVIIIYGIQWVCAPANKRQELKSALWPLVIGIVLLFVGPKLVPLISGAFTNDSGSATESVNTIAGTIITIVQTIGYITAVVMILYVGIQWLMAGTPAKRQELKSRMINIVVGAILIAGGVSILGWVANIATKDVSVAAITDTKYSEVVKS